VSISKNHPEVLKWIDRNPNGSYSDFKNENPKTEIISKYFYNTKYSWKIRMRAQNAKRNTELKAQNVARLEEIPKEIPDQSPTTKNQLLNSLVNAASNVVVSLKYNANTGFSLSLANEMLELASSAAVEHIVLTKSIVRIINDSQNMTRDEIVNSLRDIMGLSVKKSISETARRLAELTSQITKTIK